MNKEEKKLALSGADGIVPQLRFPEFVNNGNWVERRLEKLSYKISDGIHSTPQYDENGEYFFVNGNNLIDGKIVITESTKRVSKDEFENHKRDLGKNTILLSINGTIGNISEFNDEKIVLGKSACYININEEKANKLFIIYSLKTERIRSFFDTELTGSTIKNLSLKTVKNTIINIPNPKEQQKIAACLSSLDEVITAETEKLDLLQDHKKGLLQQLFPAEGETQPKFRFPEFKGDGEWEETTLDEVAKIIMGSSPKSSSYNEMKIGLPLVQGNADIKNRKSEPRIYTSEITKECEIHDILLSVRAPVGTVAKSLHKACIGRGISAIRSLNDYSQEFLYQWLLSFEPNWTNISQGGTFDSVNSSDIKGLALLIPPKKEEQQKIAQCLSAADNLIEAQTQKIAALQEHKKGLLQGLFPNVND